MGREASAEWSLKRRCAAAAIAAVFSHGSAAEGVEAQSTPRFGTAREGPDPVSWLLAQASIPSEPPPPEPAPRTEPRSANSLWSVFANDSGGPLRLAPMRWHGNMGIEQRALRSGESGRRDQTIEFIDVDLSTYIAQPWLAQVRANLGLLAYQQRAAGNADLQHDGSSAERALAFTGGGTVMVFPASRFPFSATFSQSDSRTSGEATPSDFVNRMVALRQAYRSPLGDQVYGASLERSTLISESFGRDTVTSVSGTAQRTLGVHQLDFSGNYAQNRRSQDGIGSDIARVSGHHSWRPDELVDVETFASMSLSDLESPSFAGQRSRFVQANTFGTWRPEEESPLFVTGGVRFADASFGASGAESVARTLGVNAAASYALSDAARLVGSASVNSLTGDGKSDVVTTQSLGANYSPAPVALGPLSYSWGTSFSGNNQTGGVEPQQHAEVAQANHQASAMRALAGTLSVNGSVNQGLSVQEDSLRGLSRTLTHSLSMGTRWQPTPASDGLLTVSLGDARTQGARVEHFQLLNVQTSGQVQLSAYSLLSANLTVQVIRQNLASEGDERNSRQLSGTASFQQGRLFGVRSLRLVSSATFNDLALESRLAGDVAAPRDTYNRLYESRLQYDIGRLEIRFGMRLAKLEAQSDRQFFLRVNRRFGTF